jgi:hypothetical protein
MVLVVPVVQQIPPVDLLVKVIQVEVEVEVELVVLVQQVPVGVADLVVVVAHLLLPVQ